MVRRYRRPHNHQAITAPGVALSDVEALRRRLRRLILDVHDGPLQSLVAVGYGLSSLRERLTARGDSGEAGEHLALMVAELARAERALRDLIATLEHGSQAPLNTLDLIAYQEVARFRQACPAANAELEVPSAVLPDSHSQEIAITSVLREALTNIAKHASAENVFVRLRADPVTLRLTIEDDGNGFDPAAVSTSRIGLTGMGERVRLLGGELTVESKAGGPTLIRATFRRWRSRDDRGPDPHLPIGQAVHAQPAARPALGDAIV